MQTRTEISYRAAAVDSASPIGFIVALYDTLAGNLARAAEALRAHDIERRCSELNHAYTVLGHLESWLDPDLRDPLTDSLKQFYGYLRARMLEASLKQSPPMLEDAIELVLKIRATWQEREALSSLQATETAGALSTITNDGPGEHISLSRTV